MKVTPTQFSLAGFIYVLQKKAHCYNYKARVYSSIRLSGVPLAGLGGDYTHCDCAMGGTQHNGLQGLSRTSRAAWSSRKHRTCSKTNVLYVIYEIPLS